MTQVVSIDLGAQSGRVTVGSFDGTRLEVEEVHRFANEPIQVGETLHWDVLGLYRQVVEGLRAAKRAAGSISSVAVDAWAVDFGLLDRGGKLLRNPLHYRDAGRGRATDMVLARIPPRELYERTGIQFMPINTVFELAALAGDKDAALAASDRLLLIPDLIHYWLCGSQTTERTNATTTQCFDPLAGGWASDLLDQLEIPTTIFPEIVEPGTVLGPLTPEVVAETGLSEALVVAVGTHDTASAVAAVPFEHENSAYVSAGSWSLVGLETAQPLINDLSFGANLTNEGGVAATNRLLRNVNGLWLLHECRDAWQRAGELHLYEQLATFAERAPALTSFIDPDDPVFHEPGDVPERVRDYCANTGQPVPETSAAITRCVVESIALKQAHVVDLLEGVTGQPIPELHIVGGGSRNRLLCQTTSDATGRPVTVGPVEATTIGNLLVQLVSLGDLGSLDDGRALVRASFASETRQPSGTAEIKEAYERFGELVGASRPVRT